MLATQTQVVNAALDMLGEKRISDIDDPDDNVAVRIKDILLRVIDEVQAKHVWQSLIKRFTLAQVDGVDDAGDTRWAIPTDCLVPKCLTSGYAFKRQANYLYTGDSAPVLEYQSRSLDPGAWDVFLQSAIIYTLAKELAYLVTQNVGLAEQMEARAARAVADAQNYGMLANASGYSRPEGFNWRWARQAGSRGDVFSGRFQLR